MLVVCLFSQRAGGPNTKDAAHRRGGVQGATVHSTSSHVFRGKREDFLSNKKNKERFISLLRDALEQTKCNTEQAVGDADLSIVITTISVANSTDKPTNFVGDDRSTHSVVPSYSTKHWKYIPGIFKVTAKRGYETPTTVLEYSGTEEQAW